MTLRKEITSNNENRERKKSALILFIVILILTLGCLGASILKTNAFNMSLENAGEGALYHHERYDGGGYPEGKAGEEIPLIARIICVADSFDAMNTNRVYRKKLSREVILNELESNKGTQFDPKIADIMLELLRSGEIKMEE